MGVAGPRRGARRLLRPVKRLVKRLIGWQEPPRAPKSVVVRKPKPPLEIETRHLDAATAARVEDWFHRRIEERELSGKRSVIIADAEGSSGHLKIKGAGLKGRRVRLGQQHDGQLPAPRFDFEGRMEVDVASSHENAPSGGASFQQAATEFEISRGLTTLGYDVVPCLGFGRIRQGDAESWFSVFDWDANWRSVTVPHYPVQRYDAAMVQHGRDVLDLARWHSLVGYFWYVGDPALQAMRLKDLHPFYRLDPVNQSRVSWAMQVFFALHITTLGGMLNPRLRDAPGRAADSQALAFRAILPDVTPAEHEALRLPLVGRYMRQPPVDFNPRALHDLLRSHRLTAALLEQCPPEYADP